MTNNLDHTTSNLSGRLFVGEVIDIIRPGTKTDDDFTHGTYKFKVRVKGLHDGISDSQLSYVGLIRPVFRGASKNIGEFNLPRKGSKVRVEYEDGDHRSGFITGEALDGIVLWDKQTTEEIRGHQDEHGNFELVREDGSTTVNYSKTLDVVVKDSMTITCGGSVITVTPSKVTIKSSSIELDGPVITTSTITSSGTIESSVDLIDGTGKSLRHVSTVYDLHTHAGVKSGPDTSSIPTPIT